MHPRTLAAWSALMGLLASCLAVSAEARVVRDLAIPSPTLGQPIPCAVTLPEAYDREPSHRFPVLLLLHGTDGGHHDWLDWGGLADGSAGSVAQGGLPFIIVTPGAGNSWYIDNAGGEGAWETALVDDLLPAIDARFRTIEGRARPGDRRPVHGRLRCRPPGPAPSRPVRGGGQPQRRALRARRPGDRRRHRRLPRRLRRPVRPGALRTGQRLHRPLRPAARHRPAALLPVQRRAATSTASMSRRCASTRRSSSATSRPPWSSAPATTMAGSSGATTSARSWPSPARPCRRRAGWRGSRVGCPV